MLVPIIVPSLVYCLAVNGRLVTFLSVKRLNIRLRVYESIIASDSVINVRQLTSNLRLEGKNELLFLILRVTG
jgi:hypothetical protein